MRLFIALAILAGVWIGFGAPVPFLAIDPLPPNPDLPTFKEAVAEHERQASVAPPASAENPERRKLRQAVLHAARQFAVSPCNADLRNRFLAAVKPFVQSIEDGPREVAMVNGREQNLSEKFDKPALNKVFDALMRGDLDPRDLAGWRGAFLAKPGPGALPRPAPCNQ
ncbi:MAG: hypothetical protein GEU89_00890 [Kiloniellaceae bacterium]|nr:hypothetical protein [Kiloniellaceae bacterium]